MVEPRFRWTFPDAVTPSPSSPPRPRGAGPVGPHGGPARGRGASTADDIDAWFADPLDGLHDPSAPARRGPAPRPRLRLARDRGERVLVFGDFDADGLTGLAIMTIALRRFGVAVEPYVPSRLDEGHGLSLAAIDAAVAAGASVIVTVDCGTTSVAEVAAANARGIDVIVTDHHRVPAVLPAALADRQPAPTGLRPTRTAGWPAAASRSRSPSSCSPTSRAARPRRST